MNYEYLVQVVLIAISYYLFSQQFFKFAIEISEKELSWSNHFICFIIIYLWFVFASVMKLPLMVNWFVFLIILGIEVYRVQSFNVLISSALSMFSAIIGLAVNIFFRSLMAILMEIPLSQFDNTLTSVKFYPIFSGFVFMAALFYILRYIKFSQKLKTMLQNKKSLVFYSRIEGCIYLFLMLQLLAYSQAENLVGIKLWGIKAAIFSIIVLLIANVYTLRVASLNDYMEKQHQIHEQLIQDKEDINKLWELAYVDMLTGCHNRQLFDKRLDEYVGYGSNITLAFIDLNELKRVNDEYGHLEGDLYLKDVVECLFVIFDECHVDVFRYGGDEFVLLTNSLEVDNIVKRLEQVNKMLEAHYSSKYLKSISFGVVQGNSDEYQRLIKDADQRMYKHKKEYYEK